MSKKRFYKEYLDAINALIEYYEGNENAENPPHFNTAVCVRNVCPLCAAGGLACDRLTRGKTLKKILSMKRDILKDLPPDTGLGLEYGFDCLLCPWAQFLGKHCMSWTDDVFSPVHGCSPGALKKSFNGPWVKRRLKSLYYWKRVYETAQRKGELL